MSGGVRCRYLIGDIAVAAILVDGPEVPLADIDQEVIRQQVGLAFGKLAALEPRAQLSFGVDWSRATVEPRPVGRDVATDMMEQGWLPAALSQLGQPHWEALVDQSMREHGCDQGFALVITRLPVPHFAYSSADKITLAYGGGGYGLDLTHAVLMHEICHVFGAADEVGACHCGQTHGHLQVEHGNCHLCVSDPQPCIMAANALTLCEWTRRQVGWDPALYPSK